MKVQTAIGQTHLALIPEMLEVSAESMGQMAGVMVCSDGLYRDRVIYQQFARHIADSAGLMDGLNNTKKALEDPCLRLKDDCTAVMLSFKG